MTRPSWDDRYATGDLPWDTGQPDRHLIGLVEEGVIRPGRTLEIGCGTGTNALWLASHGFDVLGVDLSARAIAQAEVKAAAAAAGAEGPRPQFIELDFLTAEIEAGPFDFVFDRGVFHVFDDAAVRAQFAHNVARLLDTPGQWLSLAGSTEGPEREQGPPRRSARDLVEAVEPVLEIVELSSVAFDVAFAAKAWRLLSRTRTVPAQPSTKRGP